MVQKEISTTGLMPNTSLSTMISKSRSDIIEKRTFYQRLFSYKTLHGILMTASFYNIVGRVFVTGLSYEEFTCYTAPAYKPIDTKHFKGDGKPLTLVPGFDAATYRRQPWAYWEEGWLVVCFVAPAAIAGIVALIYSLRKRAQASKKDNTVRVILP